MSDEPRSLEEVVEELATEYALTNKHKNKKDKLRLEFFDTITANTDAEELAEKVVFEAADSEERARKNIERRYPAWIIDAVRPSPDEEGTYEAIIRENPEMVPFTIEHNDKIWQRTIVSGSAYVDDEALQQEDPELYERVTTQVTQLVPLEEVEPHDLAKLQKYIFEGKPKITLPAPKNVAKG